MAATVYERYGFSVLDRSAQARDSIATRNCPFVDGACIKVKQGGVCSIKPVESNEPVIVCPRRMYFNHHEFLASIAETVFRQLDPKLADNGLPQLVEGSRAREESIEHGRVQVGVLGQGWGSEVKLPPSLEGGASYSIDFTMVAISPEGDLLSILPVEVQSIDTTDSYKLGVEAHDLDGSVIVTKAGLNWENVSKRILPQLIVKGLMLQGERLSTHGIYFVTPEPVFRKIAARLGGMGRLREIPTQPGSITLVRYAYSNPGSDGTPIELHVSGVSTISTSDMSIAFISPQNLPLAGSYETRLRTRLKMPRT